mmetsp:Transcript_24283/g.27966  ORF Transcript_24283/g.27966 Transcript_24283/m.27966 type:complete len:247 (+) Transcript_24283:98-838(+)
MRAQLTSRVSILLSFGLPNISLLSTKPWIGVASAFTVFQGKLSNQAMHSEKQILFPHSRFPTQTFTKRFQSSSALSSTSTEIDDVINMNKSKKDKMQSVLAIDAKQVILYDGVCNFCNTWVDILLRIDLKEQFKFAPLQSDVGKELLIRMGKEADDISSIVLVENSSGIGNEMTEASYLDKSACVLKVVEELGIPGKVFAKTALAIVPKELRDTVYDTVAENRYNFMGKRDECRCSDPKFSDRFLL